MFGVETYSFLPNQQSDRGNFACQCKTCHMWLESSDGQDFLGAFELPALEMIFPTRASLQCQADVGPQLALGAKTIRRLQQRYQQSGADGTDRRNLPEQLHCRVLAAFRQQFASGLLT